MSKVEFVTEFHWIVIRFFRDLSEFNLIRKIENLLSWLRDKTTSYPPLQLILTLWLFECRGSVS